jgi:hypothetical protein
MRKKQVRCGSEEEINIFSRLVGNGRQKEIGYGIVSCFFILELSTWLGENHVHRRNKQLTSYQSWSVHLWSIWSAIVTSGQNKISLQLTQRATFFFFEEQGRLTINCEILTGTSATLDTHTSEFWAIFDRCMVWNRSPVILALLLELVWICYIYYCTQSGINNFLSLKLLQVFLVDILYCQNFCSMYEHV